jgi:hypothetical protein
MVLVIKRQRVTNTVKNFLFVIEFNHTVQYIILANRKEFLFDFSIDMDMSNGWGINKI